MCYTIRNEKRNFFENIDTKKVTDNKIFYETVKHLFQINVALPKT